MTNSMKRVRHVYISCDDGEQALPPVARLCSFLHATHCEYQFTPYPPAPGYPLIEAAIEQCDVFIAIVAAGYNGSTRLNHELHYAWSLQRTRTNPRPRIFALQVENNRLPRISEQVPVEWLDESNQSLVLEGLR